MKKMLSLVIALVMSLSIGIGFAGCGKVQGTYKFSKITMLGGEMNVEDFDEYIKSLPPSDSGDLYATALMLIKDMQFTLNDDGSTGEIAIPVTDSTLFSTLSGILDDIIEGIDPTPEIDTDDAELERADILSKMKTIKKSMVYLKTVDKVKVTFKYEIVDKNIKIVVNDDYGLFPNDEGIINVGQVLNGLISSYFPEMAVEATDFITGTINDGKILLDIKISLPKVAETDADGNTVYKDPEKKAISFTSHIYLEFKK